MDEEWDQMHRITACKPEEDYKLWLRFEDGLEGSVFLGNLLDIGAFTLWRDPKFFEDVRVRDGDVVWGRAGGTGIALAAEVLHGDLVARGIKPPKRPIETDPAFLRFMVRAVLPAAESLLVREIVARAGKPRRRRA